MDPGIILISRFSAGQCSHVPKFFPVGCKEKWYMCNFQINLYKDAVKVFIIIQSEWSRSKKENGCLRRPQMAEKGKGEKERYVHPNAEFQRIARRDKKAFLSAQCKEIEKNNRMGKTRELFDFLTLLLKSRDITLLTKAHLVKAMVFPVVIYRCESRTLKKAED